MVDIAGRQATNALRDTAVLLLLFDTGVRRSEVCRLCLADVIDSDHLASTVTVHGKGDKDRRIEMHPQTQRALFDYLVNERPPNVRSEAVFLARGSRQLRGWHPLTAGGISQLVERLARRASVEGKKLGPHTMRHGFSQEYLESDGARIEDLQILLGHASIAMSLHYAGQAAATARRGAGQYSPVAKLGLHLGKRLQRGRPKKALFKGCDARTPKPLTLQRRARRKDSAIRGGSVRARTRVRPARFLRLEHFGKDLLSNRPRDVHAFGGWLRAVRVMVDDAHQRVNAFCEMRRRQTRTQYNEHPVIDAKVSTIRASPFFSLRQAGSPVRARRIRPQQECLCGEPAD
jgi:hypothetical protein